MGIEFNIDFYRSVSRIFSKPVFKEVIDSGNSDYIVNKINKYDNFFYLKPEFTIRDVIKESYNKISKKYRNEYVYKNILSNEILLQRGNIFTTSLISEFKISASIADLILINGKGILYEIKTELDTPDKLEKQIKDYSKAFRNINIVTHHSLAEKYLGYVKNLPVGVISLTKDLNLDILKEAPNYSDDLSNLTMLKCLRKKEYSNIIFKYYGYIPQVSDIDYFKECVRLSERIDPEYFHQLMMIELKNRTIKEKETLLSNKIPKAIKYICACLNPSISQYKNLKNFLNKNISECISHT